MAGVLGIPQRNLYTEAIRQVAYAEFEFQLRHLGRVNVMAVLRALDGYSVSKDTMYRLKRDWLAEMQSVSA